MHLTKSEATYFLAENSARLEGSAQTGENKILGLTVRAEHRDHLIISLVQ
jgi:hypothetical protein